MRDRFNRMLLVSNFEFKSHHWVISIQCRPPELLQTCSNSLDDAPREKTRAPGQDGDWCRVAESVIIRQRNHTTA